jgi:hypothetical protein
VAKAKTEADVVLRWSDYVPASEVQDPLGLALRGSARLASTLLYCITSITPRARYFSFLPWAIFDHQQREKGKPYALGLRDAIILREQALTLGSIAHHDGQACSGGALVGTLGAKRWLQRNRPNVNLRKVRFAKNPALSAYFNSLVNLGFFVTDSELTESEEEREDLEFDDIQLTSLGAEVSKSYDSAISGLAATRGLATPARTCAVKHLAHFGGRGGLCELAEPEAPDRDLLRRIFFDQVGARGESHRFRKLSLLLILELCRQLASKDLELDETAFGGAVYFGAVKKEDGFEAIAFPRQLHDIALRWRMFYFHHYMSVALEGAFAWFTSYLQPKGLAGDTIARVAEQLNGKSVSRGLTEALGVKIATPFGHSTPAELCAAFGVASTGPQDGALDAKLTSSAPLAENNLASIIRTNKYLSSPTGLAVPLVLLGISLRRYRRWETSNQGRWLANYVADPHLDLLPPIVHYGLTQRFGDWWTTPWQSLANHVLARYVVRQHISMSYLKSASGDRCLIQDDGQRVIATGNLDEVGMGNGRFWSARQVLADLALVHRDDEDVYRPTKDGLAFLKAGLAQIADEVH